MAIDYQKQAKLALANFLAVTLDDLVINEWHTYTVDGATYRVLSDSEADLAARDYILDSLWAFKAEFIADHLRTRLAGRAHTTFVQSLEKMQGELCEDANEIVNALIYDHDQFVDDAISADGRGHFLAG